MSEKKLYKFMMVHKNIEVDCKDVQSKWRKLADLGVGTWERTYTNEDKGVRYCIWIAESEEALKNIFTEIGISWESILMVEETKPDLWGEKKWKEHLEREAVASTLGN